MSARPIRNNVKAGGLVLGSIALATAMILTLANFDLLHAKNTYIVRFAVSEGAMGLKKDSEVRIGGQRVGAVTAVSFIKPDGVADPLPAVGASAAPDGVKSPAPAAADPVRYVYVTIKVATSPAIYRDAHVNLELPLLGSGSNINIPSVGGLKTDVGGQPVKLAQNEMIEGHLAPPSFMAQAGYADEQRDQLQLILRRGASISQTVDELVHDTKGSINTTLTNVQNATDDLAVLTRSIKERSPGWMTSITTSLENVQGATEEARYRTIEVKAIVAAVNSAIEDNRPRVDAILASVDKLTDNFNKELYQTVKKGLEDGQKTVAEALAAGQKVNAFLDEELPGLHLTMANARLAGDQLKLAMVEIRRSPWRLLYQPERKEIEEELLYDSVRMYADAVSNLEAASKSLDNVVAAAPTNPDAQREVKDLTTKLMAAFKEYEKANKAMLDQVLKSGGAQAP